MSALARPPGAVSILAGGFVLGMLSWLAAFAISGKFEPYDSSSGLLANQLVLAGAAATLALQCRPRAFLLCLIGAYAGMNFYSYVFGGSEQRAWALLGAVSSAALVLLPGLVGGVAAIIRRLRIRPASHR